MRPFVFVWRWHSSAAADPAASHEASDTGPAAGGFLSFAESNAKASKPDEISGGTAASAHRGGRFAAPSGWAIRVCRNKPRHYRWVVGGLGQKNGGTAVGGVVARPSGGMGMGVLFFYVVGGDFAGD